MSPRVDGLPYASTCVGWISVRALGEGRADLRAAQPHLQQAVTWNSQPSSCLSVHPLLKHLPQGWLGPQAQRLA